MRALQVLDDDDGLDDVALAVDEQRELEAASGLRQSPRLRVAATGSNRPNCSRWGIELGSFIAAIQSSETQPLALRID
jgi:hypothetical protein